MSADNIAADSESVMAVSVQPTTAMQVAVSPVVAVGSDILGQSSDGKIAQEELHPWPHIQNFYVLESRNGELLNFHCVMCEPKVVTIKEHISSLNNLKSHVNRNHPSQLKNFEDTVKAGSQQGKKRKSNSTQSCGSSVSSSIAVQPNHQSSTEPSAKVMKPKRQSNVAETFQKAASGVSVRQNVVDMKIVDLFVYNMLPHHVVESSTFVSLIKTLNPSKTAMSRRTLGRKIVTRHKQLEEYIIR